MTPRAFVAYVFIVLAVILKVNSVELAENEIQDFLNEGKSKKAESVGILDFPHETQNKKMEQKMNSWIKEIDGKDSKKDDRILQGEEVALSRWARATSIPLARWFWHCSKPCKRSGTKYENQCSDFKNRIAKHICKICRFRGVCKRLSSTSLF